MPTTHELKCWPEFFDAVASGAKTFEVRKNDRGFQTGDTLRLLKWDPNASGWVSPAGEPRSNKSKADMCVVRVTYVLSGMGIEPGYVCMGITLDDRHPHQVIREIVREEIANQAAALFNAARGVCA